MAFEKVKVIWRIFMATSNQSLLLKIEQRVSTLLKTKTPKEDLQDMYRLQKEHTPHLTQEEAEDYVILGLIETHKDHELDHLWYQYKNALEEGVTEAA